MKATEEAWEHFIRYMRNARPALDVTVPVAAIFLPVEDTAQDDVSLDLDGRCRVLWPADFPIGARGPLLRRIAQEYENGTITR